MQYWLMKSEPSAFSIDDLQQVGTAPWDGVRNYQVRNMFRDTFAVGDKALFYHSNAKEIGVVGEMKISSNAYPDPTQFDPKDEHYDSGSDPANPRWLLVDVSFVATLPRIVTLDEIRKHPHLRDLPLVKKGNRLSVMPITKDHYHIITSLAKT